MSEFIFPLTGGLGGRLAFQAAFSREVETMAWWMKGGINPRPFLPIPSGPILFQTLGDPPIANETLEIAESPNPDEIAYWVSGVAGLAIPPIRSFILPAGQVFKQFISVNGPYIGLRIIGISSVNVTGEGLVSMAPSTMLRTPNPISVNLV